MKPRITVLACLITAPALGETFLETNLVGFIFKTPQTMSAPSGPLSDSLHDETIFGIGDHSANVD